MLSLQDIIEGVRQGADSPYKEALIRHLQESQRALELHIKFAVQVSNVSVPYPKPINTYGHKPPRHLPEGDYPDAAIEVLDCTD